MCISHRCYLQNHYHCSPCPYSEVNELAVVGAFRSSLHVLLDAYPNTFQDDEEILRKHRDGTALVGPIVASAVRYRYREKQILLHALDFLSHHEQAVLNGSVLFQLELKAQERIVANQQAEAHRLFMEEVQVDESPL